MSSAKIFTSPAAGPVPLPQHAQDTPQAKRTSKKRSADVLDAPKPPAKKKRTSVQDRERERYEKLHKDSLCIVSPTDGKHVECRRCGQTIKLSNKNNYDSEHWVKHRRVCLKHTEGEVAAMRIANAEARRKAESTPELTTDAASDTTGTNASANSEASSSRAPSPPAPAPAPHRPWLDARRHHESHRLTSADLCAEYLAAAHLGERDDAHAPCTDVLDAIQAWTPARLRPGACFAAAAAASVPDVDPARLRLKPATWWDESDSDSDVDADAGDDLDDSPGDALRDDAGRGEACLPRPRP
ncbi:hypothetical protein C8Q78DRAFT_1182042 [Trametes maxima]|nr:hypothetical protein C8Q78DRAFT_1182042 [Trametes maxima]